MNEESRCNADNWNALRGLVESASVKRGSDAVADNEERARLRLRSGGKRGQSRQFLLKVVLLQFREARARVLTFLLILLRLRV